MQLIDFTILGMSYEIMKGWFILLRKRKMGKMIKYQLFFYQIKHQHDKVLSYSPYLFPFSWDVICINMTMFVCTSKIVKGNLVLYIKFLPPPIQLKQVLCPLYNSCCPSISCFHFLNYRVFAFIDINQPFTIFNLRNVKKYILIKYC